MSSKTNKSNNRRKKGNRNQNNGKALETQALSLKVVRIHNIVPPRVITTLKYIVNGTLNNVGGATASRQMNANGIYDVDPAVASTAVPGFAEWITFYQRYRVLKVRSSCKYSNSEAFAVVVNLGFEPVFYAANAKTQAYYEGSCQKNDLLPVQSRVVGRPLSMTKRTVDVVGDAMALNDLNYTGTSGTNPASLFYTSISATSVTGAFFTVGNGVAIRWEIFFDVEFFERRTLNA